MYYQEEGGAPSTINAEKLVPDMSKRSPELIEMEDAYEQEVAQAAAQAIAEESAATGRKVDAKIIKGGLRKSGKGKPEKKKPTELETRVKSWPMSGSKEKCLILAGVIAAKLVKG
jgi:hypothetical protein